MQIKYFSNQEIETWNDFIDKSAWGDILQFWQWGEAKRSEGWEPYRLAVVDNNEEIKLCAQVQIKPAKFLGNYMYIGHGPVMHTASELTQSLPLLTQELKQLAQKHNCFVIEIEPKLAVLAPEQEKFTSININKFLDQEMLSIFLDNGFRHTGRNSQPVYKLLYDLDLSDEGLLAMMHKNTRYNVGYAERQGVEIIAYLPDDPNIDQKLLEFYDSMLEMQSRTKYPIRPLTSFQRLFKEFKGSSNIALYEAKYQGDTIAFNISERTSNWSSSFYAGSYRIHSKVKAPYLLRWQSIQDAKQFGSKVYDFWGIIPNSASHKGYSDHKLSFGGIRIDHVGILALPLKPIQYLVWHYLLPLRNKIYRFFHQIFK